MLKVADICLVSLNSMICKLVVSVVSVACVYMYNYFFVVPKGFRTWEHLSHIHYDVAGSESTQKYKKKREKVGRSSISRRRIDKRVRGPRLDGCLRSPQKF